MKHRFTSIAAAIVLAVSGMVATADASQAVGSCTSIGEFSPKTVVVGLSIVTRDFRVATPGCTNPWHLDSKLFHLTPSTARMSFHPGFNSLAGAYTAEARVDDGTDFDIYRTWVDGFHLLRRTSWSSFNASPEPVKAGRTITIKGKLVRANWDLGKYYGYTGQPVLVQFRTPHGSYATVRKVWTNSSGWVNTGFTAKKTGVWRLVYVGNRISGPTTAYGDSVKVS